MPLNGVFAAPLVLCFCVVADEPRLIARPDPSDLPPGRDAIPHGRCSAVFGGRWLREAGPLALVLPSLVAPQARNLMLNPLDPAITTVALLDQVPFRLDQRLTGS